MEKPSPIRLPDDLEKEEEEMRRRTIQARIENDRKNGTLVHNVIEFLKSFEVKVIEFNQYLQLYMPYPTISQTIKDIIRNKLRKLNEFYYSYTGSNPHSLLCECMAVRSVEAQELHVLYTRLTELLNILNNNTLAISNKQIIFIAKRKSKENSDSNEYDWT